MITRRLQYELVSHAVGPLLLGLERWQSRLKRRRPPRQTPFGPPLEAGRKLKDLLSLHYLQGRYADGAVPVAWVTSGFPVELLRPLGFHVVYPENHGALCGARRRTAELSEVAEGEGFSRDLCSYARCDLGSLFSGKSPVGRLPKPDLLCCCTNICQTVLYWYRTLAERLKVPLVVVDTPFVYGEAAAPHLITYVRAQLDEARSVAERVAGKAVAEGELREVVARAREGSTLWGECLAYGQKAPSPWTGFDAFFHMAPIVAMRGTEECNAYYRLLRDELADRARRGIGGVRDEKHRLLWDNLPIWFGLRELSTLFAERGFNFVCATYTGAWADAGSLIDPAAPLPSMAHAYAHVILNQDLPHKLALMKRMCAEYKVEGAVLHSDRSCKPYSIGQLDLRERLATEAKIKTLVLEADHADPRAWSPEQAEQRLHAFMEGFA